MNGVRKAQMPPGVSSVSPEVQINAWIPASCPKLIRGGSALKTNFRILNLLDEPCSTHFMVSNTWKLVSLYKES